MEQETNLQNYSLIRLAGDLPDKIRSQIMDLNKFSEQAASIDQLAAIHSDLSEKIKGQPETGHADAPNELTSAEVMLAWKIHRLALDVGRVSSYRDPIDSKIDFKNLPIGQRLYLGVGNINDENRLDDLTLDIENYLIGHTGRSYHTSVGNRIPKTVLGIASLKSDCSEAIVQRRGTLLLDQYSEALARLNTHMKNYRREAGHLSERIADLGARIESYLPKLKEA